MSDTVLFSYNDPSIPQAEVDAAKQGMFAMARSMPAKDAAVLRGAARSPFALLRGSLRLMIDRFDMREDFTTFCETNKVELRAWYEIMVDMHLKRTGASILSRAGQAKLDSDAASQVWQVFLFGNLEHHPKARTFRLAPILGDAFMHTDVKVPCETIALPVPFMRIDLPRDLITLHGGGAQGQQVRHLILSKQRVMHQSLEGRGDCLCVMQLSSHVEGQENIATIDTVPLHEEMPFADAVAQYAEYRASNVVATATMRAVGTGADATSQVFGMAANCVLYATNQGADIVPDNAARIAKLQQQATQNQKGSKKRKKAERTLYTERGRSIFIMGGSFAPKDSNVAAAMHQNREVRSRHLVRGHWKMQACGRGHQDRRHVFIEPYWRGPELAELVERTYDLR